MECFRPCCAFVPLQMLDKATLRSKAKEHFSSNGALLHKGGLRRAVASCPQVQATRMISTVPRALKRLIECDIDVDFGSLAVWVSRRDALELPPKIGR